LQLWRQAAGSAFKQGFSTAEKHTAPVPRQKSAYRRLKAVINDYKKLSKFRLSALVALTASAGYAAGSGDSIDYAQLAWTSLGTLGAAACANTLNQLYEVFNDSRMTRTANRPLPAGRLSTRHAKVFALLTGAAGLWVLADKVRAH
jgi:protoheme IX farnesyltransferase